MPYKRLIRLYTERKEKITLLLNDRQLPVQRKLALIGAIDEINLFISILNQYQDQAYQTNCKRDLEENENGLSLLHA